MYFTKMPNIYYEFQINGAPHLKILKDVTTNVRFIRESLSQITVYDEYDIEDGETPEIISNKVYGTPMYHWAIMLLNERFDYREDFPLEYTALLRRVEDIYGVGEKDSVHHYVATIHDIECIVNSDYPSAYAISNFIYEETLNESKRRIKLISPAQLDFVVSQYSRMFI